jgi:CRISPR system Cascade subunit CasB
MTTTDKKPPNEGARKILESIERNIKNDNGAKASLKRVLTGEPRHIRAVYSIVLPYLGGINYNLDEWIFVAALLAYYPQKLDRTPSKNFGLSASGLASATNSEGADRRFHALLDTSLEDIRSPLSALIRQMKTKDIAIDYPKLIVDLCQWNHSDQYIQDQWAKSFRGYQAPKDNSQPTAESNT